MSQKISQKQPRQSGSMGRPPFFAVLKKSGIAFAAMVPLLLGVVGLVGIFQVTVTPEILASLFGGNPLADTLTGTLAGAVAAGNPLISYILGGELLRRGISLFAVTAFILSWVSLGVIQLPAEVEIFGGRFTLYRNLLSLIFTIVTALATTFTLLLLS